MNHLARRALLAAPLAAPSLARAQPPVARTARILVGFPAGGTVDVVARMLAEKLRGAWAPQVVVEQRVGAAGRLAIEAMQQAENDGTTLLITPASMVTIYPHLYGERLRYVPARDLTPVSPVVVYPFGLAVGPGAPGVNTVADLVAFARQRGGLNYASPAAGSMPHFAGVVLGQAAGIEVTHVPYRGAAPAIADLLGGQIAASFNVIGDQTEHHRAGRLRMLAHTNATRLPRLPDVPTFIEAGFPQLSFDEWFGIFLPARAPAGLVAALNGLLGQAGQDPELKPRFEEREFIPAHLGADAFASRIEAETRRWGPIVRDSGFRPEE
ncbi:tripartite tricarboxylate transporter substrate-binding protein [Rhodovarius lipocyclicus]|uniref:tripartite tricarboxylate transporter substrate-binding protein n=1 Tax=Rhodovarius lipocyclicus TaxID=268410 RepID=UPI00135C5F39|nr:tripartite tricarboxylate transporter substrate-binding protein [Rhodovarius lipocyclicus]